MKEKTWNFKFIDNNDQIVQAKIEFRYRLNNKPEFSITAEASGYMGQCEEKINPGTDAQAKFLDFWDNWHCIDGASVDEIKIEPDGKTQEEVETKVKGLFEEIDDFIGDLTSEWGEDTFDEVPFDEAESILEEAGFAETEVAYFLAILEDLPIDDIHYIEEPTSGHMWSVAGVDYLAGNDDEMEGEWDDYLENYIDECILPELNENYHRYFDREKWKSDARMDGRAHSLNSYNGGEESREVNGTIYYAYRR